MGERYDIVGRSHRQQAPLAPYGSYSQQQLPPETQEPSLLRPILRRWWLVALFASIGAGVAFVYLQRAQTLYTSIAKLNIQPTAGAVAEALGVSERSNYLSTQLAVITGTQVLNRVAETDGIRGMKTFDPAHGNPVVFLREELDAQLERKNDLIVISLSSPYPEEAAKIVEAVINAYETYSREEKDDRSNQLLKSFENNKQAEDKEVEALTQQIRDFRVANPGVTLQADGNNLIAGEIKQISDRLGDVQMRAIEAKAMYGPQHRLVQQLEQQEREFQKLYEEKMGKLKLETNQVAELQLLASKLDAKKEMSRRLADRIQQQQLAVGGRKLIDIDVIEPPLVPDSPSYPRKHRTLAVAIVTGGLLGAGLALLRDRMDHRMRSVEEIQTVVNLPILGVVPAMTGRRTAIARAMTVHLDPHSVVAEAYRTIRTAVYFGTNGNGSGGNNRVKTILMTSPEPGDGKTTCASNLAIAIAQTGRTVLLLDADFRKPSQHKNLEIKDSVGLSSVLAGQEPLEAAIQHTGVEGLDILPCGPIPANPSEILNSREFGELIDTLASRYDHILFDSPPVNAVTDARILGAVCDATILVLRADKSTKKAGEHARNALLAVGSHVIGAVVNDAPQRGGYEAYGGKYYYGTPGASAGVIPQGRQLPPAQTQSKPKQQDSPRRRNIA